jgi:adenylate kinase
MDRNRNYVNLIITGNPGVGKHTIANLLEKQTTSYQMLDINKFAIEKGLGEKVEDGIEIDTVKLTDEIQKMISDKSLIVGHLAPYVFNKSIIDLVIVLRKNPYDLIEIYKQRDYQDSKIKENVGSEILGVIANDSIASFGKEKTFEIDTTKKMPEEIVNDIIEITHKKRKTDNVDWLNLIEKNRDFDKFF